MPAGAVIDDAAVTPKYVAGFSADRELPIIWRIAKGSFVNKLVYLLPVGLALSNFAPWAIPPLLMLGGAYLCFEGAEKVAHVLGWGHGHDDYPGKEAAVEDPAHLEEQKAQGAIKTDFILSAEIMTIALAAIPASNFWMEAATLAAVAIMITVAVYGSVAIITRAIGRGIVKVMPGFMKMLPIVGTAAMLWVGGSIIVHGLAEMGWHGPEEVIYGLGKSVAAALNDASGFTSWATKAAVDGVLGLAVGFVLITIGEKVITPIWRKLAPKAKAA